MNLSKKQLACLLVVLARAPLSAPSPDAAEIDIILPQPGGLYNFSDRGIAVVIAVQNAAAANPHNWSFSWQTHSLDRFKYNSPALGDLNAIRYPNVDYDSAVITWSGSDGTYIAVGHPYYYSSTSQPWQDMLPGRYSLNWTFSIGPWCRSTNSSREYAIGRQIAEGTLEFTAAADAPFPTPPVTGTCASFAAAVSYGSSSTYLLSAPWTTPPIPTDVTSYEALRCVPTSPVTDQPEPCRATLDAEQAASISSLMKWSGRAGQGQETGALLPQGTNPRNNGGSCTHPILLWYGVMWLGAIAMLL